MSLSKEILEFLDSPETLKKILKEIRNVMSKVQELQAAFDEMKQTIADEASELQAKFDELQAQIDARVDPSSLEPIIADIRGSISNVEALSEGTAPSTPTEPTEEVPPVEEPPVEEPQPPVEETPVEDVPSEEVPTDVEPAPPEEAPTEETPVDPFPVEEMPVEETPSEAPAEGGNGSDEEPIF
jgi:hypothetical protein